jgi:hypothetical protein
VRWGSLMAIRAEIRRPPAGLCVEIEGFGRESEKNRTFPWGGGKGGTPHIGVGGIRRSWIKQDCPEGQPGKTSQHRSTTVECHGVSGGGRVGGRTGNNNNTAFE